MVEREPMKATENALNVPMLDLERQYAPLRQELLEALTGVLDSRQFILGGAVEAFEVAAAEQLGVKHAIGCSSGTDALWLALAAAEIGHGEGVLTTPFSFFASVSAILRAGAKPVLADIDPVTFNLDAGAAQVVLASKRGTSVKAILPVHIYGQCADWNAFNALRHGYGLKLIEDAAQAWGAEWKGVKAGGLGDAAAFSFYPTKNLSAAGDAGMVTTNSDELAERIRMLRQHGMRRRYYHDEVGWNARMDGFQGAVLSVKLKHIDSWNEARRAVAARYDALFRAAGLVETGPYPRDGVVLPFEAGGAKHVWHQYVIRSAKRDALREFLTASRIGSEIYYPVPLHLQEALQPLGYKAGDFPEAERAAHEVLALPIFPEIREEEQQAVVRSIAEFLS
ncbi:DegT/DnrJ/EryC1/StrS family aminotransferase [Terracidiphilus gabretensis]|jgi:dTDP-4-amino-4,6-dideoxygalactose transaminase|uniref:DegT/DnrJ/EryC1/StrS family aminotransferase n=1 Tax=Terracidiphilus gabretensis TaxID=1577687 RepID=UPI000AE320AF|nr:DegT/DnrJ/EryC1/StrS family aminotransferase [Terracidiphilus gabretensis]